VVFYTLMEDEAQVQRVLHGSVDPMLDLPDDVGE
jgi:hypothetical protein